MIIDKVQVNINRGHNELATLSIVLTRLEKQDNAAYLKKLESSYCQKNCTSKVDAQEALKQYCEIKGMSQAESNFCFLEMIDASTRILVCQAVWQTIYGIG
ncbi:38855_t:CDS:2 [Gigaspora margarita]|uniref:38855_t:CDS:1 n=1 Tax=Gigaspora margarita TaxID=4874 RepID=A0ABN7UBB2_GIGMA|nr:38855_t:CDS:2 [Gigaspora margarita]